MDMKLYLCGPMTGIDAFNYPLFFAESDRLHKLGYSVENPAANPEQADWASYLRVALTQMLTCDAVALLPGWATSRGACLEVHVAKALGMPVLMASDVTEMFGVDIDAAHTRRSGLRDLFAEGAA